MQQRRGEAVVLHGGRQQLLRLGLHVQHDLSVDDVHAHAPALGQFAEQQLVGQGPLDPVLQQARQQEAAIAYQKAVLQGWHEVVNALASLQGDAGRRARLAHIP